MLIPDEPGHNRSSSPSATLADIAERKVPNHGSRANPTIDQRHDFRADAYNAISSGCRTVKSVRTSHAVLWGMLKPLAYWPFQSVRVLDVMNEHI